MQRGGAVPFCNALLPFPKEVSSKIQEMRGLTNQMNIALVYHFNDPRYSKRSSFSLRKPLKHRAMLCCLSIAWILRLSLGELGFIHRVTFFFFPSKSYYVRKEFNHFNYIFKFIFVKVCKGLQRSANTFCKGDFSNIFFNSDILIMLYFVYLSFLS